MNITDVDDKIIRNAVAQHKSLEEYTAVYTKAFLDDCATLRLERPERLAPATEHIPEMVEAIERLGSRRPHVLERRLGLLPDLHIPRIRQAFAQRFQRQPGRRARGRGRVRKGRRPRLRSVEGAEGRRAVLADADRAGPSRLAHRVLRDGDQVPGRDARHSRRRRRPDLSAPRKRDRAIGVADRQAVRALLAALRVPDGGRPEDVEIARQLSTRCATCWPRAIAPEAIRYLLASVPYRKQLNFTFDGLKSAATAIERLRNFKLRLETDRFAEGVNEQIAARTAAGRRRRSPTA